MTNSVKKGILLFITCFVFGGLAGFFVAKFTTNHFMGQFSSTTNSVQQSNQTVDKPKIINDKKVIEKMTKANKELMKDGIAFFNLLKTNKQAILYADLMMKEQGIVITTTNDNEKLKDKRFLSYSSAISKEISGVEIEAFHKAQAQEFIKTGRFISPSMNRSLLHPKAQAQIEKEKSKK